MNLGNRELELTCERAIGLLCRYMPIGEERKKPILLHAVRVGMYLFERDYAADIVVAGFLHDIIEWTESPEDLVQEFFGQHVFDIILANTQNRAIDDKAEQWRDMVVRCAAFGKDALIVKAADTLDSFRFYKAIEHTDEIGRSVTIARLILQYVPDGVEDSIFTELKKIAE